MIKIKEEQNIVIFTLIAAALIRTADAALRHSIIVIGLSKDDACS
jgi:hypothetical protein